jgi:uncharacterized protein
MLMDDTMRSDPRTRRVKVARRIAPAALLLLLTGAHPAHDGGVGAVPTADRVTAQAASHEAASIAALHAAIDAALAANEPVTIDWRLLAGLNYRNGEVSDALKRVDGRQVRIPGFIVPLEDYLEESAEFLLVPYYGACIHTPPPPPNQMVHVVMEGNRKARTGWWEPIWLEGRLDIRKIDSPYGEVGFQLAGLRVTPYEY